MKTKYSFLSMALMKMASFGNENFLQFFFFSFFLFQNSSLSICIMDKVTMTHSKQELAGTRQRQKYAFRKITWDCFLSRHKKAETLNQCQVTVMKASVSTEIKPTKIIDFISTIVTKLGREIASKCNVVEIFPNVLSFL